MFVFLCSPGRDVELDYDLVTELVSQVDAGVFENVPKGCKDLKAYGKILHAMIRGLARQDDESTALIMDFTLLYAALRKTFDRTSKILEGFSSCLEDHISVKSVGRNRIKEMKASRRVVEKHYNRLSEAVDVADGYCSVFGDYVGEEGEKFFFLESKNFDSLVNGVWRNTVLENRLFCDFFRKRRSYYFLGIKSNISCFLLQMGVIGKGR